MPTTAEPRPRSRQCTGQAATAEPGPLSARRLAQIWQALPECERLSFVLSLDEAIADEVIETTHRLIIREQRQ